ncbi:hypothetical protein FH972_001822 [Carpinus fangiana]|uniref:Uncharacterized protein n=1 Tax=Carpinus fangiana TaxID=176857 RepID=A0A5N6QD28_9ROSI|nr:hypothetical protein FH972_001822 [Carpinus fangiana]
MVEQLEEGLQFSFSEEGILVCVELVNEDGEVTVLEVARKNDGGELVRVPNDEDVRAPLHDAIESVDGSSTISKVLVRNGGGPTSCSLSIGCSEKLDEEWQKKSKRP